MKTGELGPRMGALVKNLADCVDEAGVLVRVANETTYISAGAVYDLNHIRNELAEALDVAESARYQFASGGYCMEKAGG